MTEELEFARKLRVLGVRLWMADGELHYSAPKGVVTSDLRAELTAHKASLSAMLNRTASDDVVPRSPACQPTLATPEQQALWFLERFSGSGSSSAYNMAYGMRLRGRLYVDALARSLEVIVQRHDLLRSTFRERDGQALQVVGDPGLALSTTDLSDLLPAAREVTLARIVKTESRRPFDLATGPLLRVRLMVLAESESVLLIMVHHIVFDGWSARVFFRELEVAYSAARAGVPAPLADVTVRYADYARWQRGYLRGDVLTELTGYWRQRLAGAPQILRLPTDYARPAEPSFAGAEYQVTLPDWVRQGVIQLGRESGATPFMVSLAVFVVLLVRYSGQEDVCVGTTMANRGRPELESLIGLFANTVVLRVDLSDDPPFRQALGRVREACLEALNHQELPFAQLVEQLHPDRNHARNPLFQVSFQPLGSDPATFPHLDGLEVEPYDVLPWQAKFDLTLEAGEQLGNFRVNFGYSTDLFEPATIERMAAHFCEIAQAAVSAPDQRTSEFSMMSAAERQIMATWGGRDGTR